MIARALKAAADKFARVTYEAFKGDNRDALLFGAVGVDSLPLANDRVLLIKIDGAGRYAVVGALAESQGAKPGEKILFARNAAGRVVSRIAMLNDGLLCLGNDAQNAQKLMLGLIDEIEALGMVGEKTQTVSPDSRARLELYKEQVKALYGEWNGRL
jgi:hypothetical protein